MNWAKGTKGTNGMKGDKREEGEKGDKGGKRKSGSKLAQERERTSIGKMIKARALAKVRPLESKGGQKDGGKSWEWSGKGGFKGCIVFNGYCNGCGKWGHKAA